MLPGGGPHPTILPSGQATRVEIGSVELAGASIRLGGEWSWKARACDEPGYEVRAGHPERMGNLHQGPEAERRHV